MPSCKLRLLPPWVSLSWDCEHSRTTAMVHEEPVTAAWHQAAFVQNLQDGVWEPQVHYVKCWDVKDSIHPYTARVKRCLHDKQHVLRIKLPNAYTCPLLAHQTIVKSFLLCNLHAMRVTLECNQQQGLATQPVHLTTPSLCSRLESHQSKTTSSPWHNRAMLVHGRLYADPGFLTLHIDPQCSPTI